MFKNKNKNKHLKNKIFITLGLILIVFTVMYSENISEYFKGQLNLTKTGQELFTTGGSGTMPTFKICQTKIGKCLTENTTTATIRFKLPNGEFLNQISLENATFGAYQLVVDADKQSTVKVAKRGSDTEVKLGAAQKPYDLGKDDAVYVKETTGINIEIPPLVMGQGFDVFNLGYPIKKSEDINILTYENESKDKTGEIFIAYPEFMEERMNGKKMARDIIEMADQINEKIAKQLNVKKAEYYLIVAPSAIAPDFYRTTYYTASGMAYPKIFDPANRNTTIKPKYGINLEKTFPDCAINKKFDKLKCYEQPKNLSYLEYLLTHEFGHIYQYDRTNVSSKIKGQSTAFLEAATEINTAFVTSAFGAQGKFLQSVRTKINCNSLDDDHETGFCIAAYFINDIDKDGVARLFNLDKTYDFGASKKVKKYCDTWFSVMQYITGKSLSDKKSEYSKSICR